MRPGGTNLELWDVEQPARVGHHLVADSNGLVSADDGGTVRLWP